MEKVKFLYYKKYDNFNSDLSKNKIADNFIVFIEDSKTIWTHGQEFSCNGTPTDINNINISNSFGNKNNVLISQKTITNEFNSLWKKLEEITGESYRGIDLIVSPEYFVSENGCNVHIVASSENGNIFDYISFYINNNLVVEAEGVYSFEYDTEISDTSTIKCVANIMGSEYIQEKTITRYDKFWLGAGNTHEDVMNIDNAISINNNMRGAYDVNVRNGQHIIIVLGDSLKEQFIRADMNSIEIPFEESTVVIDGNIYKVFKSINKYVSGTYNIDING